MDWIEFGVNVAATAWLFGLVLGDILWTTRGESSQPKGKAVAWSLVAGFVVLWAVWR